MTPLTAPYTTAQLKSMVEGKPDTYVTGRIALPLDEIVAFNLEGFLDLISEKLVGSTLLMDITYKCVGSIEAGDEHEVLIEVTGDVSMILTNEQSD